MAQTTTAALQAAIDTITGQDVGSPSTLTVLKEDHDAATYSRWYCEGNGSLVSTPAVILADRCMWVRTTVSGTAADQAAEVIAAMTSAIGTIDGNIDPDIGP